MEKEKLNTQSMCGEMRKKVCLEVRAASTQWEQTGFPEWESSNRLRMRTEGTIRDMTEKEQCLEQTTRRRDWRSL